jgi:hypothetical protein
MQKPSMAELSKAGSRTDERTSSATTLPKAADRKTGSLEPMGETPVRMCFNATSGAMFSFGLAQGWASSIACCVQSMATAAKWMDIREFSPSHHGRQQWAAPFRTGMYVASFNSAPQGSSTQNTDRPLIGLVS